MAARRIRLFVLVTVGAVLALGAAALIALQTPWARGAIKGMAERQASRALGADVSIGALDGSLLYGARLENVVVTRDGATVASIGEIAADYDGFGLLTGPLDIERLAVRQPRLEPPAIEMLASLGGSEEEEGAGRALRIGEIVVTDGRVTVGSEPAEVGGFRVPDVIRDLNATLSLDTGPDGMALDVTSFSFRGEAPEVALQRMTGTIAIDRDDLILKDIKVQLAESSFDFGGTIEHFRQLGDS